MAINNTSNKKASSYIMVSQSPKDYVNDNYFLKEFQDKVNADWRFRPNRVDVEQEIKRGTDKYKTMEVVIQSVKTDSGMVISDDWRRIVFREINYACPIGTKFRIAPGYDPTVKDDQKNIFLVVNKTDDVSPTSAVVIERCNGTLGSIYLDDRGVTHYHYEPAIQEGISNTGLHYDELANDPSAVLTIKVQHNEYTRNYYINQRFVIGYDRVYRITNIDKFYANGTYNPQDVGVITLYLAIDEISNQDDLATRIAYNKAVETTKIDEDSVDDYSIRIISPKVIPNELSSLGETFEVALVNINENKNDDEVVNTPIHIEYSIEDTQPEDYNNYIEVDTSVTNKITLRKRRYCSHKLNLKFYISADESPVGKEIITTLTLNLSGLL